MHPGFVVVFVTTVANPNGIVFDKRQQKRENKVEELRGPPWTCESRCECLTDDWLGDQQKDVDCRITTRSWKVGSPWSGAHSEQRRAGRALGETSHPQLCTGQGIIERK